MTRSEFIFDLPTDSVEFFGDDLLAVGMYKLEEASGSRHGRIEFIQRDKDSWERAGEAVNLNGGLLDMKWVLKTPALVTATSKDVSLVSREKILSSIDLKGGLNLSVDVNEFGEFLVSTSEGQVFHLDEELAAVASWKAHAMETWCVVSLGETGLVVTGADDFLLKLWDTRDLHSPCGVSKVHQAGVCSVVPLQDGMLIATGSYDKQLRIFDLRNLRQPLSTMSFDSGVWRIKKSCIEDSLLLLGCMHDGFHVVDWNKEEKLWHQPSGSLAYGCSWSASESFIAGASFYDCKVIVSTTPKLNVKDFLLND